MTFAPITDFGDAPLVEYPSPWNYRLIGVAVPEMHAALVVLLESRPYAVRPGNQSRTGRYCSIDVELVVHSDEDRHELFARFKAHPAFVYVL